MSEPIAYDKNIHIDALAQEITRLRAALAERDALLDDARELLKVINRRGFPERTANLVEDFLAKGTATLDGRGEEGSR